MLLFVGNGGGSKVVQVRGFFHGFRTLLRRKRPLTITMDVETVGVVIIMLPILYSNIM